MAEACEQRAKEAVMKEATQEGKITNCQQWSEAEIERFKCALAKYRSGSNVKLVETIGTRPTSQVNIYKFRFLNQIRFATITWRQFDRITWTPVLSHP